LNESFKDVSHARRDGIFSAVSAGFFFVLVGLFFVITPNLLDEIGVFFRDFDLVRVPNLGISLPAPVSPWAHSVVYSVAERFSFVWGIFQIVILVLRFAARSPAGKIAETMSNIAFWLGASVLISALLNETTTRVMWFEFWAAIIVLLGLSLIVRAVILAAAPTRHAT